MSDEAQQWTTDRDTWPADGVRAVAGLQVLILLEIAAFAELRRRIGVARADLLMVDVAERVAALLPDATVTTAGRNLVELALLVPDRDALDRLTTIIHDGFAAPLSIDGEPYRLTPCLGIAAAAALGADEVQLLEQAEAALAATRPGSVALITPAQRDDAAIGRDLRLAIARDELFIQYQPKLHLRRQEIGSVEALIRWQHPQRGLVLPSDFIPAAERTGEIAAMTRWIIKQAIADQRVMGRNGYPMPVFINVAGALLSDKSFVADVIALIQESGAKLGFEITETSVIDEPELAIAHLQQLAAIGVAVAIDDYGAGLSSLAYLKQLPATELKIDKLFVTQLTSSHRDPLIVRSTIDLAHAMEMEVVAEGVETPTSMALLSVMGCDMVQGFLISRPLALEALLAYLREERHRAVIESARSPVGYLAAVRARA